MNAEQIVNSITKGEVNDNGKINNKIMHKIFVD